MNPDCLDMKVYDVDGFSWPTKKGTDRLPDLAQYAGLRFHYGAGVADSRTLEAYYQFSGSSRIRTRANLDDALEGIMIISLVPEVKIFVLTAVKRRIHK